MEIVYEDYLEHFLEYFKIFEKNAPKYMVDYIGGHGLPNGMASSLESCIEFAKIVKDKNARILNAGAGASSWVLRKIFPNVICTDPDEEYLDVVKKICEIGGLSTDNFTTIPPIENEPLPFSVDYCYYDYGNWQRMPFLKNHIEATKKALYIDDTDDRPECSEYRNFVLTNFSKYNLSDCREAKDSYGRWGIILMK